MALVNHLINILYLRRFNKLNRHNHTVEENKCQLFVFFPPQLMSHFPRAGNSVYPPKCGYWNQMLFAASHRCLMINTDFIFFSKITAEDIATHCLLNYLKLTKFTEWKSNFYSQMYAEFWNSRSLKSSGSLVNTLSVAGEIGWGWIRLFQADALFL